MVKFDEVVDGEHRYLQVSDDSPDDPTKLLVYEPLVGGLAKPWPEFKNYSREGMTERTYFGRDDTVVRYLLKSREHPRTPQGTPSQTLCNRMDTQETRWGHDLVIAGEFQYARRYWEWVEDILVRCGETLTHAQIFDAVYASLFTYECLPDIIRAFCESWSPSTNTLVNVFGEVTVSLWDMHKLGGLPILGDLFDEVIPSAEELTGVGQRCLPATCGYLLHAYHLICRKSKDGLVSLTDWIKFWYTGPVTHEAPPRRAASKSRRCPTQTHNPTGVLPALRKWNDRDIAKFTLLNIPVNLREETYLAAFISCWLCLFALPSKSVGQTRPGVFKMACFMARGEQVGLAVPVLSSIYRGLNGIARSATPGKAEISFPVHYLYAWIAAYFNTHFSISALQGPLMVMYRGEGSARYYTPYNCYKRIRNGHISWSVTQLRRDSVCRFVDEGDNRASDTSYFLSMRSNFLPLRDGPIFRVEPYNPHRFARQFGFCQELPGSIIKKSLRRATLEEGLKYWRACTITGTTQQAMFPLYEARYSPRYSITTEYNQWLKGPYAEHSRKARVSQPYHEGRRVEYGRDGIPLDNQPYHEGRRVEHGRDDIALDNPRPHKPTHGKGKELQVVKEKILNSREITKSPNKSPQASSSTKRRRSISVEEVNSHNQSSDDRNFKHVRRNNATNVDQPLVDENFVLEPIDNPLEGVPTLEADELAYLDSLLGPPGELDHISTLHIDSDPIPSSRPVHLQPTSPEVSVFEGVPFFNSISRKIVEQAWEELREKLMSRPVENVLSMEDEVHATIKEMKAASKTSLYTLEEGLKSFFQTIHTFHDAQLHSSSVPSEEAHSELLSSAMASLTNVQSQIEEKGTRLADLEKQVQQEKEALLSLQSDKSSLDKRIASLNDSRALSKEETFRLQQLKMNVDIKKQELREFELHFIE